MFWILRRTGAVNLFNSIGNGNTAKTGSTHSNNSEKSNPRPPRKAYGRLSVESDDAQSRVEAKAPTVATYYAGQLGIPGYGGTSDNRIKPTANQRITGDGNGNRVCRATTDTSVVDSSTTRSVSHINNNNNQSQSNGHFGQTGPMVDRTRVHQASRHTSIASLTARDGLDRDNNRNHENCGEIDGNMELELDNHIKQRQSLSQLHTMVLSDDDDYEESLTCNVCDRSFHCRRQLASHQQKKRHFGGCDSLFPTLMLLEHHKEEFEHWSDYEDNERLPCCRRNRLDDEDYMDTETATSDAESEDLERLL
ncbi:uncharacterized protein LOC126579691 isoform X2 [Anopheles aquasalis]|uniref:uncharacterized protein LOC126579691 isoform X2 n=1 Tax=Anopheles aquasalis TaxID=42839 RepID=UPI00215A6CEB|nr:uncharacterized protein LOC126579691 isoform X2 [Anopheles aquasalis]